MAGYRTPYLPSDSIYLVSKRKSQYRKGLFDTIHALAAHVAGPSAFENVDFCRVVASVFPLAILFKRRKELSVFLLTDNDAVLYVVK